MIPISNIAIHVANKDQAHMSFISLGISESLCAALQQEHISTPYPVQTEVIPAVLSKRDVLGIAKTGSGKTLSYVLPILMHLQKKRILKAGISRYWYWFPPESLQRKFILCLPRMYMNRDYQ
jgi:superfamily II DNA/RNA helicase